MPHGQAEDAGQCEHVLLAFFGEPRFGTLRWESIFGEPGPMTR